MFFLIPGHSLTTGILAQAHLRLFLVHIEI
jgi:hypothetical protein